MSYILDALRKAERERGIRQVPTLMTDHAPRDANRQRLWIGLGIVGVILAAVLGGYFVHERETPVAELKPGAGYNRDVAGPDADQNRATALDAGASTTASSLRVPAANRPDASTERTTIATAIPRAPSAIVPRNESREQTRQNIRPAIPEEDEVILDVQDDGIGFDPSRAHGVDFEHGYGLVSLRESAIQLGGTLEIESAPGEGTTLAMALPVCS